MEINHKILSDLTVWSKYAKYDETKQRRETWEELVTRNMEMHIRKFPQLEKLIRTNYELVFERKVLPSMRSLQFSGKPIEVNNARLFNCSYLHIDDYRAFNETMFLLLSGTGVGYSVSRNHIDKLPAISKPTKQRRFLIPDNIEGWADAVKVLMKSYFGLSSWKPNFDFRSIRAKGDRLITSGGVAPGPEPLKLCLAHLEAILDRKKDGEKLTSLECHDILCHIANAVLAGGIRRSAMIALFDYDDQDMLTCKSGKWYESNPQRGRANNSVKILRNGEVSKDMFLDLWKKVELSNAGEPGFLFTNDLELGTNPCFTGDMELLTANGYKSFRELAQMEVYSLVNSDGEIVDGTIWSNGVKQIVEVKLANGSKIHCTPDHRFMDNERNEVEAKDLKGKRLMPFFSINKEVNEFTKYGFIQGDGSTGRLSSESHKGLEVYFGDKDMDVASIFGFEETGRRYVNGYNEVLKAYGFSSEQLPRRKMPESFSSFDYKDKLMFLKGMYSANGSVIKTSRVSYKTTSEKLANQLASILSSLGLKPYITTNKVKTIEFSNGSYECKESYDVNIGQLKDIIWFAENIAFVQDYKNQSLSHLITQRGPFVVSVNSCGSEEVFDFNLQGVNHWGVVEGIVAHNCGEIALNTFQFCNLVEINASDIVDQFDFEQRAETAAFIGTLQASYTDFHYLRPEWKEVTEREALLGVGMTGIASGSILNLDIAEAAESTVRINKFVAATIGINEAARITTVKPSGTASIVLGCSSGVHTWHSKYYIRRMRVGKSEALYTYLLINHPELLEDSVYDSKEAYVSVPIAAPSGALTRESESAIQFLERVKLLHEKWIKPGHVYGDNTHNVSATVTMNPGEWKMVGDWLWENQNHYNGLSFLPEDLGSYQQTPFEEIDEAKYLELSKSLKGINLENVIEIKDNTNLSGEVACGGSGCEIV
jgi:hypothetical protein